MSRPPIAFFSYARENLKQPLQAFYDDLRGTLEDQVGWKEGDDPVMFFDKGGDNGGLDLMEDWQADIERALQTTTVLVCITSPTYFRKEFCGKEYFLFDDRRRQALNDRKLPRPVVLPVIWLPVEGGLPPYMDTASNLPAQVPDLYRKIGLKELMTTDRPAYERCVLGFAKAIEQAWKTYWNMPRLPYRVDFKNTPNSFEGGEWREAVDAGGFIRGPEVVNFLFAATTQSRRPNSGYGKRPSEWRPYYPKDASTVVTHAKGASLQQSLKFREIPFLEEGPNAAALPPAVDGLLREKLNDARERKNLTVALADPGDLEGEVMQALKLLEDLWWTGTAVLFPWGDEKRDAAGFKDALLKACPLISNASPSQVTVGVPDPTSLTETLTSMLQELRTAVRQIETSKKQKTDAPPTVVAAEPAGA